MPDLNKLARCRAPSWGALGLLSMALVACGGSSGPQAPFVEYDKDPFPSTYTPLDSTPTLITNVTVLDGKGGKIENGKISAVGTGLSAPSGATVIDGKGGWVTPGIIDNHSHLGVYPSPGTASHSDGNEIGEPITADAWAEHALWPQDAGFIRAAAGGVTSLQLLPGSANLVGGRAVT